MRIKRIKVFGKVQGVWYRASTRDKATELGLDGTVKNLPDGSVEIVASGPEEKLKQLEEWCHDGPPGARVERVESEDIELQDISRGFQVIR